MSIIKILDKQYNSNINNECLDIAQIKNICNLYKTKNPPADNVSLSDLDLSSPDFKKTTSKSSKKSQEDVLKSQEFIKKYSFFIRTVYACLKLDINLFDTNSNILTLKNNYQLVKSIEARKKQLISEHLTVLKTQYKNISLKIGDDYDLYSKNYITKIKIMDRLLGSINKLVQFNVFEKTDNLLTLILPYFYTYTEFIEVYN